MKGEDPPTQIAFADSVMMGRKDLAGLVFRGLPAS